MKRKHRRGATRTQVLTIIVLSVCALGVFAVGTPVLLFLREISRNKLCLNNLRQYGIGIHTYHDVWNKIPSGANSVRGMGPSFQVAVLPWMEQSPLFDKFLYSGDAIGNAMTNDFVAGYGDRVVLPYARCPSSPLSQFVNIEEPGGKAVRHQLSSYVGIAGAENLGAKGTSGYVGPSFCKCCADLPAGNPQQGTMAVNGAFIVNGYHNFGAFRDGTSNTLMMSEQAGWGRGKSGRVPFDASSPHGWIAGTAEPKRYEFLMRDEGKSQISSVYNLTTIAYQPGSADADRPGIAAGHGPNTPLTSGHFAGLSALRGDGSVQLLPYDIDLVVLKKLAMRADGHPIR